LAESVLKDWMALCRKADTDVIAAADSRVRVKEVISKPDVGNPSHGLSIFSSIISEPTSDHSERSRKSCSDLGQVLTSFGAFCELMTLRLETDEDAVATAGSLANSPGAPLDQVRITRSKDCQSTANRRERQMGFWIRPTSFRTHLAPSRSAIGPSANRSEASMKVMRRAARQAPSTLAGAETVT